MDQRVKGGSPAKTTEDATPAPKNFDKDQVTERKRKAGVEEKNGEKGAVLELLIEGRCGTKGDQISGKDSSCPEGNVRLRIGLQAKRTKKPPKILESYVCKPTIRTYQRQGRGAQLRGEAEGGVGQQSKTSSIPDEETSREPLSGLDCVQTSSKQTTSAPPPEAPSSLSTSSTLHSLSSALTTTASADAAQCTKSSSQVLIKTSDKTEVISNGTSEKVKKSSFVNGLNASVEPTSSLPKTAEHKTEIILTKKPNDLVQPSKLKGLINGKGNKEDSPAPSDKSKSEKNSTASSISSAAKLTAASSPKELSNRNKSPSISSVTSCQPQSQDAPNPLMQSKVEKRKDKKSKKDKRRDKKSKRERLEAEKKRSQSRSEESRRRKERGGEEKTKHGKEQEERHRGNDLKDEQVTDKNDKSPIQESQIENAVRRISDNISSTVVQEVHESRLNEQNGLHSNCREVDPVETTGDTSKSKEQDISRHSCMPQSQPIPTVPASSPTLPAPASPPEQDSRPLKKRKARRPSWTRLVHRAQKAENHEAASDSQCNPSLGFPPNPKASLNPRTADESHASSSSTIPKSSSPSSVCQYPASKQSHLPEPCPNTPKIPPTPTRKRGRPKSSSSSEASPKPSPNLAPSEEQDRMPKSVQLCLKDDRPIPRKRGRPPKHPVPNNHTLNALTQGGHGDRSSSSLVPEKGNRQLNIRRLINEMKKRKKKRFHKVVSSGPVAKTADAKSIEATAVQTLSSLSSSFGGKLGPQINVSKKGTIYMGKRRGRKPKVQSIISHSSTQFSLFTSAPETSLFSTQLPASHPFPSPSLTHSSGAQSPYSEGSFSTDPAPGLLFSQPFSLPSPSSSCTSPRPPSSSSLSSFVRKSCPCQGRPHFPFHQSTCKLSHLVPPSQHTPGSPGHLKEATASPRSESHSEETLPSDSGIGTDNNSVSERGEMRGGSRGMLRVGQSSGIILGSQKHTTSLLDHPSPASPPLLSRHTNPNRDRHRHRRRDFDCSSSCACLCACSGLSTKCTHSDFYSCHNALKRQKNRHKKKHQQHLHLQNPEFLAELEDLIALFNEIHIGRRSWARAGLVQGYEGGAPGGRKHHSSHSLRSNIFRINLNGFYSPHPSAYTHNPPFPPQPLYTCHPVHCNRKLDRRPCACTPKFQDPVDNMYRSYPSLYNHIPNSFAPTLPSQFALHQSPQHFFLNPARFHRRRSRQGGIGGEESVRGSAHLGSGFTSNFPCACGRGEHKHKHKHRHRHCDREVEEDEMHEHEVEREGFVSKQRAGFIYRQEEVRRKGASRLGSVLSKESPWSSNNRRDVFPSVTASCATERFKQTPLTSLGLGSAHLSSFGGGWGALGQGWAKYGGLGGTTFSKHTWTGFGSQKQHANKSVETVQVDDDDDDDDDEEEENETSSIYGTSQRQGHTNLFTSTAVEAGARAISGAGDPPWRREEPVWMDRREAGSQSHLRYWGHQKSAQPSDDGSVHRRRGPGRPRKYPLPVPSASSGLTSAPEVLAGNETTRREARAESAQLITEVELQAKKKKGRKRKHSHSPCYQSVTEEKECETGSESSGQSDVELPVPTEEPVTVPQKSFLKAGLYSDDYKTTDSTSHISHFGRENAEYSPGEQDYSLLPAPLHVGKYLRLKRIHFQLPYDVMWLWQHDQLCRQPAVPLKRKRRYSRPKEKTLTCQANDDETGDITNLFPHLDMDPLTSYERSFVVKHHVFLLRNWELVRDRQIHLRIERERHHNSDEEEEEEEDDSHIKSDQPVGEEKVTSSTTHKSQETSSSCSASPCFTKAPNQPGETDEERRGGEEVCRREQRRKRLNDLLSTLQHS